MPAPHPRKRTAPIFPAESLSPSAGTSTAGKWVRAKNHSATQKKKRKLRSRLCGPYPVSPSAGTGLRTFVGSAATAVFRWSAYAKFFAVWGHDTNSAAFVLWSPYEWGCTTAASGEPGKDGRKGPSAGRPGAEHGTMPCGEMQDASREVKRGVFVDS